MRKNKNTRKPKRRPARKSARRIHSQSSILEHLRTNVLFTNVRPKAILAIIPKLKEHHYKADEIIFDEFTKGRMLYLIARGKVRIKKYTKYGIESLLAVLHEGDFFGELSIIDGFPRSARAEAVEESTIFSFKAADYRMLIEESDAFTENLLRNLALRLRTIDQTFVTELERSSLATKQQIDKLNLLIEASKTVNSTIDSDRLLGLILTAATRSINADRGTLYFLDRAKNELWSKVAQGKDLVEIRLPIGKGLAGYVAKTGETVNITEAYKDPRFNPEIDRKSGYKTRNVLCMPMRNKEGTIVGVFQFLNKRGGHFTRDDESFIDALSVHAAIAVENARLVEEMIANERLSAVGRMASTIIHDIKNPMATLRLYAQVIKGKTENKEAAQMAEEMIRQVDRFVNMTQEILDFSRGISELRLETVELSEVLPTILGFIDVDLEKKNVKLIRDFEFTGAFTMDVEKMVRVFYNLAANAADAMSGGGSLTIRTRTVDGTLAIEFQDSGRGIPDEIRSRIFEPFFTHGKQHGTGLGLSIVKRIVDDHGGTIQVESEKGSGTTVRLLLPFAP